MILHASAVDWEGRGVLIRGSAGSGKSSLALALMAFGARLVGDDRVRVERRGDMLRAGPGPNIAGMIEARGIGILNADTLAGTRIHLIVDLDQTESERLPKEKWASLLDLRLPCLHKVDNVTFPAAILQYLKAGRAEV